ncbi:hypothetical protein RchiOBHm_Chr4g0408221 [Rosa chinensis]|uniref:Uncharacterized protein n=1 Tax=Rosa chinensis TaxID=74649 RepID=A0A2P6QUX4_ROSCH|nr:hypothetical protein RchiOBHm_Chr4g0408221 [Rosa chinensis]
MSNLESLGLVWNPSGLLFVQVGKLKMSLLTVQWLQLPLHQQIFLSIQKSLLVTCSH